MPIKSYRVWHQATYRYFAPITFELENRYVTSVARELLHLLLFFLKKKVWRFVCKFVINESDLTNNINCNYYCYYYCYHRIESNSKTRAHVVRWRRRDVMEGKKALASEVGFDLWTLNDSNVAREASFPLQYKFAITLVSFRCVWAHRSQLIKLIWSMWRNLWVPFWWATTIHVDIEKWWLTTGTWERSKSEVVAASFSFLSALLFPKQSLVGSRKARKSCAFFRLVLHLAKIIFLGIIGSHNT